MTAADLLPYRHRHRIVTFLHNRAIASIKETPPVRQEAAAGLMFLSMLRHTDVLMYLVAMKPIYRRLGPGLITIVNDGSLTIDDCDLLERHLGRTRFLRIEQIDTGCCPRGGTWERLLAILDHSREHYVIQVDADIVALGELREVADCIRRNRAFTLAGNPSASLETVGETSARVRRLWPGDPSIQPSAEQILDEMPDAASSRYIWGTSAFAGFPRGSGGRDRVSAFSTWMEGRLGRRWHHWGSEQVSSNFVIANAADPLVLPWSKYQCHEPPDYTVGTELNHFYGTFRFVNGTYRAHSRRAIAMLKNEERSRM